MLFPLQSTYLKEFFILVLYHLFVNLSSLELESNFENENMCYSYVQHTFLCYSQNYMIILIGKAPLYKFFLRAKK